jgi:hypothetical protein
MRVLTRALATSVAGLALTAGAVVVAGPAAATGEGCVGLPSVPAAYVCVVSLTPANAVPTVTTTYIPVTVPEVCYFVDCTGPTTVQVPVPGATPNSGYVAVIRHNNVDYPIGVGTIGTGYQAILDAEQDVLLLANDVITAVLDAYGTAFQAVLDGEQYALGLVDSVVATALDTVAGVQTLAAEVVQYVRDTAPPLTTLKNLVNTIRNDYVVPITQAVTDLVFECTADLQGCLGISI